MCVVLVAIAAVVHAVAAWGLASPWIAPDEPTYGMLGRSLWGSGTLRILGVDTPFYGVVYPAIVGLPLRALGSADGIRLLQVLQPLLMATAGLVAYAWARRLVAPRLALVAAALTVAVPALAYSGLLMTEVAFYPIATLALMTAARALEEPTLERQAVAVGMALLASLTRLQGLVLLPALVTAVGVAALFERDVRLLRRFSVALVLVVVAGGLLVGLHEAGTSGDMLGAYSTAAETAYRAGPALEWIAWHTGALFLLVAGVPLLATAVLVVDAVRGRERSVAARALLAVSLSYAAWSVVQVGVFASRFSTTLLERNLITVAPPLFICFALWLARGLPRRQPSTALVCLAVIAPAVALPIARLADPAGVPSAFTSLAFGYVVGWTSVDWARAGWIVAVVGLTAIFLFVPRRLPWALPALTLALLVGASVLATRNVDRLAAGLRGDVFDSADPEWVDRTAQGPVAYVHDGSPYWNALWIRAFWNPRIDRVLVLPEPQPSALPPNEVVSPRFDGALLTTSGNAVPDPYVLASQRMTFVGEPVRSVLQPVDNTMLTLWKAEPPVRLKMLRTGFQANGDFSHHARIDVFACGPGQLEVTLLGKDGSPVTIEAPGVPPRRAAPKEGIGARVVVPVPPFADGSTRCTFSLYTPGLVGTTVVSFVPASSD